VGELLEEESDVGDDAARLRRAAVGQLRHGRRVDVDADERHRRREEVAGRHRVQHGRDHQGEADIDKRPAHGALTLEHVGVDVGQRAVVAHRADEHELLARRDQCVHDSRREHAFVDGRSRCFQPCGSG
jgi:hypothetical protein